MTIKGEAAVTSPKRSWPAMTLPEIESRLCAPGQTFEMAEVAIRDVPTRVWKNAPPTIAALVELARGHGDAIATILDADRVSFAAQHRAIAALAHALADRGVVKGDRVAIAMRNLPEWPVAFFAATVLGAIAVPLNAWWTGAELQYGLGDSGAVALVCDAERLARIAPHRGDLPELRHVVVARGARDATDTESLEAIIGPPASWADIPDARLPAVALAPDDDATIFYTSGTTGAPKGALGTHRNLMTNILSSAYVAARACLRRGDPPPAPRRRTGLLVIPLFHVTACSASLMGSMAAGNTTIFMNRWDPLEALALIERERVNLTGGVPTIAWQLIEHPDRHRFDLSSLEGITYGGAPAAPELARRIQAEFGCAPGNGWGMTETMATVTNHVGEDYLERPESCGPPVPVAEIRIVAPDGATMLPEGDVGEIWVKGPQIVKGYWHRADATAETFVDGWVRTGDLGRLDAEGFLSIVDRARDMVIRGGENIYSSEVENVLYAHPAVTDAALVGVPHRTLGEEPAAVVHLAPGMAATEAELQQFVRARLAAFKVPIRVLFHAGTLPRNANGKILKAELRKMFA